MLACRLLFFEFPRNLLNVPHEVFRFQGLMRTDRRLTFFCFFFTTSSRIYCCNVIIYVQVRDLKERPGSDTAKLSNNEAKLTAARQRLQEATGKLYKGFGYYDAVGGTLCQPEIEMLKQAQQGFFGSAYSVVRRF